MTGIGCRKDKNNEGSQGAVLYMDPVTNTLRCVEQYWRQASKKRPFEADFSDACRRHQADAIYHTDILYGVRTSIAIKDFLMVACC